MCQLYIIPGMGSSVNEGVRMVYGGVFRLDPFSTESTDSQSLLKYECQSDCIVALNSERCSSMPLTKRDLTSLISLPDGLKAPVDLTTVNTIAIESVFRSRRGIELLMTLDVLTADTALLVLHYLTGAPSGSSMCLTLLNIRARTAHHTPFETSSV